MTAPIASSQPDPRAFAGETSVPQRTTGDGLRYRIRQQIAPEHSAQKAQGHHEMATTAAKLGEITRRSDATTASEQRPDRTAPTTTMTRPPVAELRTLQSSFALSMTAAQIESIESNAAQVPSATLMRTAGAFLVKLEATIEPASLKALYAARDWANPPPADVRYENISALVRKAAAAEPSSVSTLSGLMARATDESQASPSTIDQPPLYAQPASIPPEASRTSSDANDTGGDAQQRNLARRLLNMPDGGALRYHFGTLPVMVADQMIELDLVLFRERDAQAAAHDTKRLVMTLQTAALGKLEVTAQSVDARLSIAIRTESAAAAHCLQQTSRDIQTLVERLGWQVDVITVRDTRDMPRAADHIVSHVLSANVFDTKV